MEVFKREFNEDSFMRKVYEDEEQIIEIKADSNTECVHDKRYANYLLTSYPPQAPGS